MVHMQRALACVCLIAALSPVCLSIEFTNKVEWISLFEGAEDSFASAIASHGEKTIVAGIFHTSLQLSADLTLAGYGEVDHPWLDPILVGELFVVCISADGDVEWAAQSHTLSGLGLIPTDVAVDSEGYVYVSGLFSGDVMLAGDQISSPKAKHTKFDLFLLKISNTGTPQWARQGVAEDVWSVVTLAVDSHSSVTLTALFKGNVTFYEGESQSAYCQQGAECMLVARFNSAGSPTFVGATTPSGVGKDVREKESDRHSVWPSGVETTPSPSHSVSPRNGNDEGYVISGTFQGCAHFTLKGATSAPVCSCVPYPTCHSLFVAQYDSDNTLEWLYTASLTEDKSGIRSAQDIDVAVNTRDRAVYVTGSFLESARFASDIVVHAAAGGSRDLFVLALSGERGVPQWALRAGDSGSDVPSSISFDSVTDDVIICGESEGGHVFDTVSVNISSGVFVAVVPTDGNGVAAVTSVEGVLYASGGAVGVGGDVAVAGGFMGHMFGGGVNAGAPDDSMTKFNTYAVRFDLHREGVVDPPGFPKHNPAPAKHSNTGVIVVAIVFVSAIVIGSGVYMYHLSVKNNTNSVYGMHEPTLFDSVKDLGVRIRDAVSLNGNDGYMPMFGGKK